VHTGYGCESLRERGYMKDLGVDGKMLKWIFKKGDGGPRTGLIGTFGGLFFLRMH
jgi:hypothetical protein